MKKIKAVLIIEDDPDIQSVMALILKNDGLNVISCNNGEDALAIIEKNGIPSLILMDMRMPMMDGWQFSQEFHRRYGHSAPIIVVTAAADAQQRAKDIDASDYLSKPFDLEDLHHKVLKIVGPEGFEPPTNPL